MERVNLDVQMDQEPATHFHSYVMDIQTAATDQMRNIVTYVRSFIFIRDQSLSCSFGLV